jgi:soluble P-type ATPase
VEGETTHTVDEAAAILEESPERVRELQNFRVKINIATGHDSYEAWRENEHDDIVLAVALVC